MTVPDTLLTALTGGIVKLFQDKPELFSFSHLTPYEKALLVNTHPKVFLDAFIAMPLSAQDKYAILTYYDRSTSATIKKKIQLSDAELGKLSDYEYVNLITKCKFKEYIRPDLFDKLSRINQSKIFTYAPDWVIEHTGTVPKLTQSDLMTIVESKPQLIEKHFDDFMKIKTDWWFWNKMCKYNKKYQTIFLNNTKYCATKTDVRTVIHNYPHLLKDLTPDIIENSLLTGKDWSLLMDAVVKRNKKLFENFEFSPELREYLEFDLTVNMLKGKGSKRLLNAAKNISRVEPQQNTEDTSLQTSA